MKSPSNVSCTLVSAVLFAASASAQTTIQIPLNYNFNGIVHAGEDGQPDAPGGFRSISDRALDFTAGVPTDPLLTPYSIVGTAGMLDIVHLGNRNTVDNGNWAFDLVPDGDNIGIQPTWLPNVDQSGGQTTTLAAPITMLATSEARFLYQISNGGGTFDVTFTFASGSPFTAQLSGGDWFGGLFAGRAQVDQANPDANLSISQGTIDLSAQLGRTLTAITFSNSTNLSAGIAILAANVFVGGGTLVTTPVALNYNFNGIVHIGEDGIPDAPAGFRSISDRALDFTAGVPAHPVLDGYVLVAQPNALDIVHLGNRNTVDGGGRAFDLVPDGDDVGIQPTWLANVDQSGPQVTSLPAPVAVSSSSRAEFVYQISNGGGAFDVTFTFSNGTTAVATLSGGDWFGGALLGRGNVDLALPSANLSVTEANVDLAPYAGRALVSFAFSSSTNPNAGVAILAANLVGVEAGTAYCPAVANTTGSGAILSASGSTVAASNDLTLNASQMPANQFGFFLTSMTQGFVQNPGGSNGNLCLSGVIGRYVAPGQIKNGGASGAFSLTLDLTRTPAGAIFVQILPGQTWNFQTWFRDIGPMGQAQSNFTNGLSIAFM